MADLDIPGILHIPFNLGDQGLSGSFNKG